MKYANEAAFLTELPEEHRWYREFALSLDTVFSRAALKNNSFYAVSNRHYRERFHRYDCARRFLFCRDHNVEIATLLEADFAKGMRYGASKIDKLKSFAQDYRALDHDGTCLFVEQQAQALLNRPLPFDILFAGATHDLFPDSQRLHCAKTLLAQTYEDSEKYLTNRSWMNLWSAMAARAPSPAKEWCRLWLAAAWLKHPSLQATAGVPLRGSLHACDMPCTTLSEYLETFPSQVVQALETSTALGVAFEALLAAATSACKSTSAVVHSGIVLPADLG